jgi:transcription elongation factor
VRARPRSPDRRVEVLKGQLREAQLTVARCEAKCAASASTTTTLRVELEKLRNQRELEQHTRQIEAEVCVCVCVWQLSLPINNIFLTPAEWRIARGV